MSKGVIKSVCELNRIKWYRFLEPATVSYLINNDIRNI